MNKTYKWPLSFLPMPYTKGVFGLSVTKAFKVILMLFLYSNPIDSAQLSNLIYVKFNNFLLSTWHPLSNLDLLTQPVVTLVSQNIVIS